MDDALGKKTDAATARELGLTVGPVRARRILLSIPAYRSLRGATTVIINEDLRNKIADLAPRLAQRLKANGIPIYDLRDWQVIDMAITEMAARIEKEEARALYVRANHGQPQK
jgi:hypothetical protein